MAAGTNTQIRIKLIVLLSFACFLAAALWNSETFAKRQEASAPKPAANAARPQATPTPGAAAPAAAAPAPTPAEPKLEGCIKCHNNIEPMHQFNATGDVFDKLVDGKDAQDLSCTSCHGGNPAADTQREAHVQPRFPDAWGCKNGECSSRNPERSNTLIAKESREFVRFVNPGDFRISAQTCGVCHNTTDQGSKASRSMMAHGSMLWGAALYNNGGYPIKDAHFGESYNEDGQPQALIASPAPTREQQAFKGFLPILNPLPRWEVTQPGNILRVFERGGKRRLEIGNPDKDEDNGKPDKGLSPRGLGTHNRTDPVYLGLQKTRLLDPTSNFLGTNDHSGDYRSAGCTSCHVIYANDTSKFASGHYASAGNLGYSQSADTKIPKNEPGHPIKHQFTSQIPTSQCMTCHMHPGTNLVATYLGQTWWDNETDGKEMYPSDHQINPTESESMEKLDKNPEAASLRGLWSDSIFLQKTGTADFNAKLKNVQFADSHGHGWVFKNVYKKDRKGNLLDADDKIVSPDDPAKLNKAVHLRDIHLEKGMHCTDCHFKQDSHGTGILYDEPRAAIEIGCVDCHGSIKAKANGLTSGEAAMETTNRTEITQRKAANKPL
ncbi:MAG TPA: cytochrome c3 family protein, partial [Pyrinomonadaceae bacterium]|nr:cytochrome c3 family protein [Pyrinomonadaceae bacterium]